MGLSVLCNCARVSYTLKKRVTFIVCNLESDLKGIRNYRKSFQITNKYDNNQGVDIWQMQKYVE